MSYIGNQPTSVAFLTDQFSGTGSQTAFTLSAAPANTASILVAVSGVLQDPTTYSTSGLTLTFSAAPPSGTGNISVRYLGIPASNITTTAYRTVTNFTATAGQTVFTPPSYTAGYIDVYRNGVKLALADFTATNGTTVTLTTAATAGDVIETDSFFVSSVLNAIPAVAGAVTQAYIQTGVAGTGPAFSAIFPSGSQTFSANTWSKIQFPTKEFDTANCYDNTTNYRFTPNVSGYYQISSSVQFGGTPTTPNSILLAVYKNGAEFKRIFVNSTSYGQGPTISSLINLNGSTDYVEIYAYVGAASGTAGVNAGVSLTWFQGALVRSA